MKLEIAQCCGSCKHSFISVESVCWAHDNNIYIEDYYWCDKWELHDDIKEEYQILND